MGDGSESVVGADASGAFGVDSGDAEIAEGDDAPLAADPTGTAEPDSEATAEAGGPGATADASVGGESRSDGGTGEPTADGRFPLDAALEDQRERIEAALRSSRAGDIAALERAVGELEAVRSGVLESGTADALPILEVYLAERRSRLTALRLAEMMRR
jgi:hypothetical protein